MAAGHGAGPERCVRPPARDQGPAFVPRTGATPDEVIAMVHRAGGLVSFAHPGVTRMDAIIPRLAGAGLAALEARHSDHDIETEQRYRDMAARHRLAVSGGSDFHGESAAPDRHAWRADAARGRPRRARSPPRMNTSPPVVEIAAVTKSYGGLRPLRIRALAVAPGERVAIAGIDAAGAEVMVNLVTGASLPDEGEIRVFGRADTGPRQRRRVALLTRPLRHRHRPCGHARGVDARPEPCAALHAGDRSRQS